MKPITLTLICFAFMAATFAQQAKQPATTEDGPKINWMTIEKAQELMIKNPKMILIDVYTPWCGPCKMMDRMTFHDPRVVNYVNKHFYAVKFNAESPEDLQFNSYTYKNPNFDHNRTPNQRNAPHQFTQALSVRAYPTVVILNEKLMLKNSHVGFKQADQMMEILKREMGPVAQ